MNKLLLLLSCLLHSFADDDILSQLKRKDLTGDAAKLPAVSTPAPTTLAWSSSAPPSPSGQEGETPPLVVEVETTTQSIPAWSSSPQPSASTPALAVSPSPTPAPFSSSLAPVADSTPAVSVSLPPVEQQSVLAAADSEQDTIENPPDAPASLIDGSEPPEVAPISAPNVSPEPSPVAPPEPSPVAPPAPSPVAPPEPSPIAPPTPSPIAPPEPSPIAPPEPSPVVSQGHSPALETAISEERKGASMEAPKAEDENPTQPPPAVGVSFVAPVEVVPPSLSETPSLSIPEAELDSQGTGVLTSSVEDIPPPPDGIQMSRVLLDGGEESGFGLPPPPSYRGAEAEESVVAPPPLDNLGARAVEQIVPSPFPVSVSEEAPSPLDNLGARAVEQVVPSPFPVSVSEEAYPPSHIMQDETVDWMRAEGFEESGELYPSTEHLAPPRNQTWQRAEDVEPSPLEPSPLSALKEYVQWKGTLGQTLFYHPATQRLKGCILAAPVWASLHTLDLHEYREWLDVPEWNSVVRHVTANLSWLVCVLLACQVWLLSRRTQMMGERLVEAMRHQRQETEKHSKNIMKYVEAQVKAMEAERALRQSESADRTESPATGGGGGGFNWRPNMAGGYDLNSFAQELRMELESLRALYSDITVIKSGVEAVFVSQQESLIRAATIQETFLKFYTSFTTFMVILTQECEGVLAVNEGFQQVMYEQGAKMSQTLGSKEFSRFLSLIDTERAGYSLLKSTSAMLEDARWFDAFRNFLDYLLAGDYEDQISTYGRSPAVPSEDVISPGAGTLESEIRDTPGLTPPPAVGTHMDVRDEPPTDMVQNYYV